MGHLPIKDKDDIINRNTKYHKSKYPANQPDIMHLHTQKWPTTVLKMTPQNTQKNAITSSENHLLFAIFAPEGHLAVRASTHKGPIGVNFSIFSYHHYQSAWPPAWTMVPLPVTSDLPKGSLNDLEMTLTLDPANQTDIRHLNDLLQCSKWHLRIHRKMW